MTSPDTEISAPAAQRQAHVPHQINTTGMAAMTVPYNEIRQRPDGGAIAWHRPDNDGDDAQPWLVIEEDPVVLGVEHTWQPDEHVADWTVLQAAADHAQRDNGC